MWSDNCYLNPFGSVLQECSTALCPDSLLTVAEYSPTSLMVRSLYNVNARIDSLITFPCVKSRTGTKSPQQQVYSKPSIYLDLSVPLPFDEDVTFHIYSNVGYFKYAVTIKTVQGPTAAVGKVLLEQSHYFSLSLHKRLHIKKMHRDFTLCMQKLSHPLDGGDNDSHHLSRRSSVSIACPQVDMQTSILSLRYQANDRLSNLHPSVLTSMCALMSVRCSSMSFVI